MLKIFQQDYSRFVTSYSYNNRVLGEGVVETLSGGVYPYGVNSCYDLKYVLELVPTTVLREIMQQISGAGTTFLATFLLAQGARTERCYAHDVATELQNTADSGYWKLSFTMTTTGW